MISSYLVARLSRLIKSSEVVLGFVQKYKVYLCEFLVAYSRAVPSYGLVTKEVSFMMLEVKKLFVVALAALACVSMWGCGGDVEWSKTFPKSAAQVIGFVDDSLVIVYDYQQWHRDLGSFVQDHGDESGFGHQRLCVFNYRVQEDGPRWSDTLDNDDVEDFNYVKGQLSDSVIWGGDPKSEVSFWKIGSKPHKMKVKKSV